MLDLLRLTPMTEEQALYVNTMQGSAESLLACLNDILDFSKVRGAASVDSRLTRCAAWHVKIRTVSLKENG